VYADLVTVAGFKPVVAAEKSPGGFDSLPLPFLPLVRHSAAIRDFRYSTLTFTVVRIVCEWIHRGNRSNAA
jgi:hypothetical protein